MILGDGLFYFTLILIKAIRDFLKEYGQGQEPSVDQSETERLFLTDRV